MKGIYGALDLEECWGTGNGEIYGHRRNAGAYHLVHHISFGRHTQTFNDLENCIFSAGQLYRRIQGLPHPVFVVLVGHQPIPLGKKSGHDMKRGNRWRPPRLMRKPTIIRDHAAHDGVQIRASDNHAHQLAQPIACCTHLTVGQREPTRRLIQQPETGCFDKNGLQCLEIGCNPLLQSEVASNA